MKKFALVFGVLAAVLLVPAPASAKDKHKDKDKDNWRKFQEQNARIYADRIFYGYGVTPAVPVDNCAPRCVPPEQEFRYRHDDRWDRHDRRDHRHDWYRR